MGKQETKYSGKEKIIERKGSENMGGYGTQKRVELNLGKKKKLFNSERKNENRENGVERYEEVPSLQLQ